MSVTMKEIDGFIDTTINRLSTDQGTMHSVFYIDLRSYQTRITQQLVDKSIKACSSRGLRAERNGDGLTVNVSLNSCLMTPAQTITFNEALNHTRTVHGNFI